MDKKNTPAVGNQVIDKYFTYARQRVEKVEIILIRRFLKN